MCNSLFKNAFFNTFVLLTDDFKPASVDTTKDSLVEVGEAHQITVTVPHVEVGV